MTLKPVNDDIIFLKENVYDMMRLRANYSLAFCSKMLNHHGLKFGKKDNFNNTYGCVRKVNFYSLIEDMIVCLGKSSYNPEVSLKRAQESFYGKGKEISFKDKLSKIRDNLMSRKKLGFRLEVTVEGKEIGTVLNILSALSHRENFIKMSYKKFRLVYMSNLQYLSSLLKGDTMDDLITNIVNETILYKGSANKHFLPKEYFVICSGLPYLNNASFPVNTSIPRDVGLSMIVKILNESRLSCIKERFREVLKKFAFVYRCNSQEQCIRYVYEQYVFDYATYYKVDSERLVLNGRRLGEHITLIGEEEGSISLNYYIEETFLDERSRNSNFPYIFLLDIIKNKFNLSVCDLKSCIFTLIKKYRRNVGWLYKTKPFEGKSLMIRLDLNVVNTGTESRKAMFDELTRLHKLYLQPFQDPSKKKKKVLQVGILY